MKTVNLIHGTPPEVTVYHINCVDEFGSSLPEHEYHELLAEILSMHVAYGLNQELTNGEGITVSCMSKLLDKICDDTDLLPCKVVEPSLNKGRIHEKPFHHKGRW